MPIPRVEDIVTVLQGQTRSREYPYGGEWIYGGRVVFTDGSEPMHMWYAPLGTSTPTFFDVVVRVQLTQTQLRKVLDADF